MGKLKPDGVRGGWKPEKGEVPQHIEPPKTPGRA
jgi:hypothetical protein